MLPGGSRTTLRGAKVNIDLFSARLFMSSVTGSVLGLLRVKVLVLRTAVSEMTWPRWAPYLDAPSVRHPRSHTYSATTTLLGFGTALLAAREPDARRPTG